MSDGDGAFGGIGDELKKVGQAVVGQVTGSDTTSQKGATADAHSQLGGFGKSILGQITGDDSSGAGQLQSQDASGQLGGFGSSIVGQVTGGDTSGESSYKQGSTPSGFLDQLKAFGASALGQLTGQEIDVMKKKDKELSEAGQAEIKAKIEKIYGEHAQRKKQETHYVEEQKKQGEEQQKEFKKQEKKQLMDVQIAQTKANAEIKNLGAE